MSVKPASSSARQASSRAWRRWVPWGQGLALLVLVAGLAIRPEEPWLASALIAHGLALAAATWIGRVGWTIILLVCVTAILAASPWLLGWVDDCAQAIAGVILLIPPVIGLLVGDALSADWRALLRSLRRPRVGLSLVILVVVLATAVLWWERGPVARARLWSLLGWEDRAHVIAFAGAGRSPAHLRYIAGEILQGDAQSMVALIEQLDSWPWAACARRDELPLRWPGAVVTRPALRIPRWVSAASFWDLLEYRLWLAMGDRAVIALPGDLPQSMLRGFSPRIDREIELPGLLSVPLWRMNHYVLPEDLDEIEAYRLGHVVFFRYRLVPAPEVHCVFCGEVTGPAPGVTEHEDGSLTWRRSDGYKVDVPPPSWWQGTPPPGWQPRPTMARPR